MTLRLATSVEHRLVMDEWTNRHSRMA